MRPGFCLPFLLVYYVSGCNSYVANRTDNMYRYLPKPVPINHIEFKARTDRDVHIALALQRSDDYQVYEIVIGRQRNSRSSIRPCIGVSITLEFRLDRTK